jgi:hypothetical protein
MAIASPMTAFTALAAFAALAVVMFAAIAITAIAAVETALLDVGHDAYITRSRNRQQKSGRHVHVVLERMTIYRTLWPGPPPPEPEAPVRRTRWQRFLCWMGFHEGPFSIWLHSIDCDACGRIVDD